MPELDVDGAGGVRLRVIDHGGEGPALVCMPGAGGNLRNLDAVARRLAGRVRLVAMDTRSHGQSDVSEDFSVGSLVGDVEAVIAALDLGNPVVAGHSMGGMIAAFYGEQHPECPHVVNIDGHGRGGPSVPAAVLEELLRLSDEAQGAAPVGSGDGAWLDEQLAMFRAATEAAGGRWDRIEPGIRHGFVEVDGAWHRRPTYDWMRDVMQPALETWDLFALYRRVTCPLTIFNCTSDQDAGVPPELAGAMRDALRTDLAELAAEKANVTVVEVDTTHNGAIFQAATRTAEVLAGACGV